MFPFPYLLFCFIVCDYVLGMTSLHFFLKRHMHYHELMCSGGQPERIAYYWRRYRRTTLAGFFGLVSTLVLFSLTGFMFFGFLDRPLATPVTPTYAWANLFAPPLTLAIYFSGKYRYEWGAIPDWLRRCRRAGRLAFEY